MLLKRILCFPMQASLAYEFLSREQRSFTNLLMGRVQKNGDMTVGVMGIKEGGDSGVGK